MKAMLITFCLLTTLVIVSCTSEPEPDIEATVAVALAATQTAASTHTALPPTATPVPTDTPTSESAATATPGPTTSPVYQALNQMLAQHTEAVSSGDIVGYLETFAVELHPEQKAIFERLQNVPIALYTLEIDPNQKSQGCTHRQLAFHFSPP